MGRTQNQRSASVLRGLVYPLHIFISDGEARPKEEKIAVIGKSQSAQNWLCRQAAWYHVSLSFHTGGCFGLDSDVTVDHIPHFQGTKREYRWDWVRYLLKLVGWVYPVDLYNHIVSEIGCHNVHVLVHANTWGRSYALPLRFARRRNAPVFDGCFIYRYYEDGQELYPAIIAHELLHIYGAWDLYETYGVSAEQGRVAGQWFPNDVMRRVSWQPDELVVGPLTAWRIGWGEKHEEWYEWFRPSEGVYNGKQ